MLDYRTLRETFRIPWIRANRSAVHHLSDLFYLLLALYRSRRFRDFLWAQDVYFRMLHSFAQYGRKDAKVTVRSFLGIPWFRARRREVYRLISAYNRLVRPLPAPTRESEAATGDRIAAVEDYVRAMKSLIGFDARDEARVVALMGAPETIDRMLADCSTILV